MAQENEKPYFDQAFKNFWYDKQLVSYITQFMAVFSDIYVQIGKNDNNSQTDLVKVPIRYGGADRVVDAIIAGNTQNKPLRLPMFAARLVDIQPAPERAKGLGTHDRHAYLPRGAALPDGVKVVKRRTPIPYRMAFELSIFTSNEMQKFQILEQIFTVFDPSIQIQTSDDPFDGGKITVLELKNVAFEEQYPAGTTKKQVITSMVFETYGWLQVPLNFKENFIKSIHLRMNVLEQDETIADAVYEQVSDPNASADFTLVVDVDNPEQFPDFPSGKPEDDETT